MCLAIPGQVVWVGEATPASIPARIEAAGREVDVDLVMVPDAGVGDHVLAHSGYAVRLLAPAEAAAALDLLGLQPEPLP